MSRFQHFAEILISHILWDEFCKTRANPAGIYLLKINNRNARKRYETCSKLTLKKSIRTTPFFTRCSGVSIVNFEHVIAG